MKNFPYSNVSTTNRTIHNVNSSTTVTDRIQSSVTESGRICSRTTSTALLRIIALLTFGLLVFATSTTNAVASDAMPDRQTLEKSFPTPQQVMEAFPKEPEQGAALRMMREILWARLYPQTVSVVLTNGREDAARKYLTNASRSWLKETNAAYKRAAEQLQAEEQHQGIKLEYQGLTHEQRILVFQGTYMNAVPRATAFHDQFFQKVLPAVEHLAVHAGRMQGVASLVALILLFPLPLVTFIIILIMPWRRIGRRDKRGYFLSDVAPADDPFALPDSLRIVKLPRMRYQVSLQSGEVFDEKTWSETHIQTTTTGGGTRTVGDHLIHDPVHTHVSSTVVQKDRIWMMTTDGQERVWTFSNSAFPVARGQLVSIVALPDGDGVAAVTAYNHTTRSFKTVGWQMLKRFHRPTGFISSVILGTIIGAVCGFPLFYELSGGDIGSLIGLPPVNTQLTAPILGAGTVAGICLGGFVLLTLYITIIRILVYSRRNRAFRAKYLPAYRQFFEQLSPTLHKRFHGSTE